MIIDERVQLYYHFEQLFTRKESLIVQNKYNNKSYQKRNIILYELNMSPKLLCNSVP